MVDLRISATDLANSTENEPNVPPSAGYMNDISWSSKELAISFCTLTRMYLKKGNRPARYNVLTKKRCQFPAERSSIPEAYQDKNQEENEEEEGEEDGADVHQQQVIQRSRI